MRITLSCPRDTSMSIFTRAPCYLLCCELLQSLSVWLCCECLSSNWCWKRLVFCLFACVLLSCTALNSPLPLFWLVQRLLSIFYAHENRHSLHIVQWHVCEYGMDPKRKLSPSNFTALPNWCVCVCVWVREISVKGCHANLKVQSSLTFLQIVLQTLNKPVSHVLI